MAPAVVNVSVQVAISALYLFAVPAIFRALWPQLLEAFGGPRNLTGYGTFVFHMTQLIIGNLGLFVLYYNCWPAVEKYKINTSKPWPWKSADPEERKRFWSTFWWSIATVTFNNVCIALPSAFTTYDLAQQIGAFSTSLKDFPDTFTLLWQVAVCVLVEDTMFYFCHRFLHWKRVYPYVHKWHHSYYHSIGIASENAHPVEFLIGNLIPVVAGPLLLRSHVFVFWFWLWVRIAETIDAHSGYEFPWSPARLTGLFGMASTATHHDFHHSRNRGCFGSQFTFWDRVFGTDAEFNAFQAKLERGEEAQMSADAAVNGEPSPLEVSALKAKSQ